MSPTSLQVGRQLRALREAAGESQAAVAKRAGLSREYLNQLEAGRRDPSLSTLTRLAKALGTTVSALVDTGKGA